MSACINFKDLANTLLRSGGGGNPVSRACRHAVLDLLRYYHPQIRTFELKLDTKDLVLADKLPYSPFWQSKLQVREHPCHTVSMRTRVIEL